MNPIGNIHPSELFRFILERERARAERTGHIFSLVIFSSNHGNGNNSVYMERLGTVLVQKVRMSDEVGWYDEKTALGALLPGTTAGGALQFIDIIKKIMGEIASGLVTKVYTYPCSSNHSVSLRETEDGNETRSEQKSTIDVSTKFSSLAANNGKSVEPMGILFARPNPLWKRMFDFFGSLMLLILLSPLFLLVALFVKIASPGPVFHRQVRIGYRGKPFTFWKFRTMHVNNNAEKHRRYLSCLIENDSPMTKMDEKEDNRIIPFGKFLRYTCLDELPQLFNVLLGDMSLVGPRPCLPYEAEKYLHWHTRRFDTMPGMTGLWQVSGKNRTTFKEMIRFDIFYSRKMSLGLDTKILLLTWPAILGMVSEPLSRKTARGQETPLISPSRREHSVRG
jgi:lipopolysaccharide/colanic/teichoic acid biosynthesis glycosyltransferase